MSREEYNKCLVPYLRGSKPKEQRQFDMCIGAKICSGKAKSEDEARQICSLPKEPKPPKISKKTKAESCENDAAQLTQCMMNYFEDQGLYQKLLNVNSVGISIENALLECTCRK